MELATPGSAVRLASVARTVTDCATRPGEIGLKNQNTELLHLCTLMLMLKPNLAKPTVVQ